MEASSHSQPPDTSVSSSRLRCQLPSASVPSSLSAASDFWVTQCPSDALVSISRVHPLFPRSPTSDLAFGSWSAMVSSQLLVVSVSTASGFQSFGSFRLGSPRANGLSSKLSFRAPPRPPQVAPKLHNLFSLLSTVHRQEAPMLRLPCVEAPSTDSLHPRKLPSSPSTCSISRGWRLPAPTPLGLGLASLSLDFPLASDLLGLGPAPLGLDFLSASDLLGLGPAPLGLEPAPAIPCSLVLVRPSSAPTAVVPGQLTPHVHEASLLA